MLHDSRTFDSSALPQIIIILFSGNNFSHSLGGGNIKLKKIARRINRLPGRQQRRKLGKVDELYLFVMVWWEMACTVLNVLVSGRMGEGEQVNSNVLSN